MALKSRDLYIDLGTSNTLIYMSGRGFVLNEPSVVAFDHRSGRVRRTSLGLQAKQMLGKAPPTIQVVRPLREGVISNFDATAAMLSGFINRIKSNHFWLKPRILISLPCRVTKFEKQAVQYVGKALGGSVVQLLDEPVAAAIGAGLPVLENRGSMVVDIGGGTTEIAVLSMGGIVASEAVRIGSNHLDDYVQEGLRFQHDFLVGEQTAEKVKIAAGDLSGAERVAYAGGIDLRTGLPGRMAVKSSMIVRPLMQFYLEIRGAVLKVLEKVPPEIAGDIAQNGMLLAGGGSLIPGFADRMQRDLGFPVRVAQDPLLSVARGGARSLEDHKLFDALERPA